MMKINELLYDYKFNNDKILVEKDYLNKFINDIDISELKEGSIISKIKNKYYIDLSQEKVFDIINHLDYIDDALKLELNKIVDLLLRKYKSIKAIILIGSAARNLTTEKSDIDFLIISTRRIKKIKIHSNIGLKLDFILRTTKKFRNAYKNIDDELVIWSVKYGVVLYDNNFIRPFFNILPFNEAKTIVNKKKIMIIKYIDFLLNNSSILSDRTFSENTMKIYYFLLRLILLNNGYIPKSKNELYLQLKNKNMNIQIVEELDALLKNDLIQVNNKFIRCLEKVKKYLNNQE